MRQIAPRIAVDEKVRFGRAVIEDTRVPVETILGRLAADTSIEEIFEEYGLVREDVLAALSYAADVLANEQIQAVG